MQLHALTCIYRNPNGAKEATGEYDAAGNQIVRSVIVIVMAGESFDAPEDEARELIELGAAITVEDYAAQQVEQAAAAQRKNQNGLRGDDCPFGEMDAMRGFASAPTAEFGR